MTNMNKCAFGGAVGAIGLLAYGIAWGDAIEVREETLFAGPDVPELDVQLVEYSLPAGMWTISTKVTINGFESGDVVSCELRADGEAIDESATVVGDAEDAETAVTLNGQRLFETTAEFTSIALVCSHVLSVDEGETAEAAASLIISTELICPISVPDDGQCLPGHVFVPPDAAAGEQGAVGVCVEGDAGIPNPCEAFSVRSSTEDILLDRCPSSKPYRRCTSDGVCWCSRNGR